MPEPRWRDVDPKTSNCSHCGGTHYGTGAECPFREENMGEPCTVCGERTCYCCSDCGIDSAGREKVFVCIKDACRTEHEKKHPEQNTPKLWLWKNFVNGRPEYWAFDNPYPCHPNGDPMVLGEPCGYAILKQSKLSDNHPAWDETKVLAAIAHARPA